VQVSSEFWASVGASCISRDDGRWSVFGTMGLVASRGTMERDDGAYSRINDRTSDDPNAATIVIMCWKPPAGMLHWIQIPEVLSCRHCGKVDASFVLR
jgi:hypothetical protein